MSTTLERKHATHKFSAHNKLSDLRDLLSENIPARILNRRMLDFYMKLVSHLAIDVNMGAFEGETKKMVLKYIDVVSFLIKDYEDKAVKIDDVTGLDMLLHLKNMRDLSQEQLAEILHTSQPVVSDILSGKRGLTYDHVQFLSRFFRVSPAAFFPRE